MELVVQRPANCQLPSVPGYDLMRQYPTEWEGVAGRPQTHFILLWHSLLPRLYCWAYKGNAYMWASRHVCLMDQ